MLSLTVTNRTSLEHDESLFRDLTVLYSAEERAKLKVKVNTFVSAVLNYNPDATEQIDIRDKHLSCAENLGEVTRGKTLTLCTEQNETFDALCMVFLPPYPSWLKDVLTGLEKMISRLHPDQHGINVNRFHSLARYVPGLVTQLHTYFGLFEKARPDCERLLSLFDRALNRLGRFESDLANQLDDVRDLSHSLYHTLEFGYMIDQALIHSLQNDILPDDPRIDFIDKDLIRRFRQRMALLRIQMETNHNSLMCQYIHLRNCRELILGLDEAKRLILQAFNLAAQCSLDVLGKKAVHRIWPDTYTEIRDMVKPEKEPAEFDNLKQAFSDLNELHGTLHTFLAEAGPVMKQAALEKQTNEKDTARSFKKLKQSYQDALQRNLAELE